MQLLNQLRDDAGKLAEEAIPEVANAVEQLATGTSLAKVVVALVGRLEQDIPGIVHPANAPLAAPLTTPVQDDAAVEAAAQVAPQAPAAPAAPVAPVAPAAPTVDPRLSQLESELAQAQAQVAALQSAITPAPGAGPEVTA